MADENAEAGIRSSIWLSPPVMQALDRIAERRGAKRSAVIREFILAGIEREALVRKITEAVA